MSVPTNAIAMWTGTIAGIPANWNICNGGGTTPDLRDKFLRGAPAATEAGNTGGSTQHTHTETAGTGAHTHSSSDAGAHQHTTNTAGAHTHTATSYSPSVSSGTATGNQTSGGGHTHTNNNSSNHSHTLDSQGSHVHTLDNCSDGRPPWYDVLWLQAAAGAAVATNLRIFWSGAVGDIPANWSEDTNMRARFSRGASNGVDGGGTGGSGDHVHNSQNCAGHTHGSDSQGGHNHTFNNDTVAHNHGSVNSPASTRQYQTAVNYNWQHQHASSDTIAAHTHTFQSGGIHNHGNNVGTLDSNKSYPQYKQTVHIKNDGAAAIPVGGILAWVGLIADIPATWNLCDGGASRPDYRGYFLLGNPNGGSVGATGGADTHTHTDNAAGTHSDHTQDAFATQHTHAATDNIGNHQHGTVGVTRTSGALASLDPTGGAHSHTYNAYTWNHTHTANNNASTHQHTVEAGSSLPPYYEVQFIYYSGASGQPYISRVQGVAGMNTWNRSLGN